MPSPRDLPKYYKALRKHFGPRNWWPGETPFEVMVGAILTQNTAWSNVEKAIRTLKENRLLDPHRINELDLTTLAMAIRPAGYFNVKAKRLKSFLAWFIERFDGDVERMKAVPQARMREELLEVKGIGPETADSIMLYALGHATFVVDAYTYRILTRHELVPEDATYEDIKELLERNVSRDAALFNDFHAQIVETGKEYCRTKPRCEGCPLRRYLPKS